MPHDVYISYSSRDKPVADRIVASLENNDISCWIAPRDLKPGSSWGVEIHEAIESSKIVVLVFSDASNDSSQIRSEIEAAISSDLIIVPFRISDIQPSKALGYFLSSMHWIDAFTQPVEDYLEILTETVCTHLGITPPKSSSISQLVGDHPEPQSIIQSQGKLTLVDSMKIKCGSSQSAIQFYIGSVTEADPEDAVDVLIISAYRDYYFPMPGSVFGSLNKKGISVEELAKDKAVDLRQAFSCWISKDIPNPPPGVHFKRILCYEPDESENAGEYIGDIFRSIAPFLGGKDPVRSIATTLVAAGSSHRIEPRESLKLLIDAAANWMSSGLPIECFKIICLPNQNSNELVELFSELIPKYETVEFEQPIDFSYDFFISYAHKDSREVDIFLDVLTAQNQNLRIFIDRKDLNPGSAWQREIYEAIDDCQQIISFYSPSYLDSKVCIEEFNIALCRHRESEKSVLRPVYLYSAKLPTYMRLVQYYDCREFNQPEFEYVTYDLIDKITK